MSVSWDVLSNPPGFAASTMLLLTDGRVICQEDNTADWFALTPDAHGSYTGGTWSAIAATSIWRRYYASAVLASGKVLVAGGEDAPVSDTNVCEIYDPVQDAWTPVPPPPGWATIGDAPCAVLRDGSVLTVECNPTYPMASQRYVPATGTWVDAGSTQADLVAHGFSTEIGPAILLEDGRVVAFGGTGHTAIYTPDHGAGSWSAGPDFPVGSDGQLMTVRDAPACLLPNGRVLCCAGLATGGQGWGGPPAFFEFDPATNLLNPVATPALNASVPYVGRMLLLPTGQVLYASGQDNIAIATPAPRVRGHAEEALEPQITEAPEHLIPGGHHKVSGRRFNGVSQAVSYGDDCSAATNYPIARLRYADGRVVYGRTFDHSTMAVATGHHLVHTTVEIPAAAPSGHAHLEIVANGIASDPVEVHVK